MQILQVSKYYSPHIGGVEKHLAEINQEFLKEKHQITVITQSRKELKETENIKEVLVKRILTQDLEKTAPLKYKLRIWQQIIKYYPFFKKAEVIHVHDVFWWLLPIYPFIHKKLFITFHGYQGNKLPSKKEVLWRQVANRLCQRSIVVGKFQNQYYKIKADKVIYGASNIESKKNNKRKKHIIYLGRLEADNGILSYLHALKILKEQGKDYHLAVYGDGSLKRLASEYAQKEKLNVKFYGSLVNAQQFLSQYPQAFVSSYLSIIEALASDCQVISYADNPLKIDYLKQSPFASFISINSTAQAISDEVLANKKLAVTAKAWAQAQNWQKISQTYLNLWKKS